LAIRTLSVGRPTIRFTSGTLSPSSVITAKSKRSGSNAP
jgi:hypothetical protein